MSSWKETCESFVAEVEKAVVGRRRVIETLLQAMLCGGHVLLEDVPGVGKTWLVKAITRSLGCPFQRIQFTSDLFPADLTGVSVPDSATGNFVFKPGPLFSPVLLADEINRAAPKTQSALLEAMEEKKVTVDGRTHPLPEPFLVLATQNPLEFEGTHPLPEAQMDRFLFRIRLGYPDREAEVAMLDKEGEDSLSRIRPVLRLEELRAMREEVSKVYVDASVKQYIVQLSEATRRDERLRLGASPRASAALMRAARCRAWYQERDYVIPDDVKEMIFLTYSHRLLPDSFAGDGLTAEEILKDLLEKVNVPVFSRASA